MAPPFLRPFRPSLCPPAKASAGLCEARVARGELVYVSVPRSRTALRGQGDRRPQSIARALDNAAQSPTSRPTMLDR